jgi:hypothetical protein
LRSRRSFFSLSTCGCDCRSVHDQSVYTSRVGSRDYGRSESAASMDGIFYLVGDRFRVVGGSAEHLAKANRGFSPQNWINGQ